MACHHDQEASPPAFVGGFWERASWSKTHEPTGQPTRIWRQHGFNLRRSPCAEFLLGRDMERASMSLHLGQSLDHPLARFGQIPRTGVRNGAQGEVLKPLHASHDRAVARLTRCEVDAQWVKCVAPQCASPGDDDLKLVLPVVVCRQDPLGCLCGEKGLWRGAGLGWLTFDHVLRRPVELIVLERAMDQALVQASGLEHVMAGVRRWACRHS